MKESLFDIFNSQRHANWMEFYEVEEMRQEAALYADSLLPLADRWKRAVEDDVNRIATKEPPHLHFNQKRVRKYHLGVWCFLSKVAAALINHGFDIGELDRVTQWRLGQQGRGTKITESLSMDEAKQLYKQLKKQGFIVHCFRELCTNEYTVLSYKVEASQTMLPQGETPPPPPAREPKAETPQPLHTDLPSGVLTTVLDTFQARRVFGKAISKGYMTYCNGNFDWKGVTDRGRNVQLAYLCGKIYCYQYTAQGHTAKNTGNEFPESELYSTFWIPNLQQSLFQFYDRPAQKRQKWIDKLDELFE